ncbi:uncharacterized protein ACRADG_001609 [Cochliomyia hominivorax]
MGFTQPDELERTRENCIDWEKQEINEIKQNSLGLYKRKYSRIKQRFYYQPQKSDKSRTRKISESDKIENFNEEIINILVGKQEEQQEFEEKLKNTKGNLKSLEEKLNDDIEHLEKPFKDELKRKLRKMERKKRNRVKDNQDTTWAESLKENRNLKCVKEISKEQYSFKHQGVSTSPRYYGDKNLALRPKMRSVASQIGAENELLDQGAVGDHNSLKPINSLKDFTEKTVCQDLRNETIVNCCYGLTNHSPELTNCQGTTAANKQQCHYCNCQQRGLANQPQYSYCCEEYYYNVGNCNCLKSPPNCGQERDYRRQITDLNTDYFFHQPKDKNCTSDSENKNSRRKSNKYKSKESSDEFNENKKREFEERLKKLQEKTNRNCYTKKPEDSQKLKQLLKEENAKKLIKYLDQYVEDHERQLRENFKNLQTKEVTTSSTTLNSTILGQNKEKYFQIKIKEQQKRKEIKVTKSLEGQYSKATLKMLKKMTIREYKPKKSIEKEEDKQYLDKIKNYHDYKEKFEKEMNLNKSLETLKSPPEFFPPQDSETNELFENIRENLLESSKAQNEADKEQRKLLRDPRSRENKRDHQERRMMYQDSLQSQTITSNSNREHILSHREQIQILREQVERAHQRDRKIRPKDPQDASQTQLIDREQKEQRQREHKRANKESQTSLKLRENILHREESLNDTESFEAFRYEYGPECRETKTWDDYRESYSLENQKYEEPFKEESAKQYREIKRKPKKDYKVENENPLKDYVDVTYKFKEKTRKSDQEKPPGFNLLPNDHPREMSELERFNLLKRIVDSYERTGNKIRKDFSEKYEDKRKEILERNEYQSGKSGKREYQEINVERNYIREQFEDVKLSGAECDQDKINVYKERRSLTKNHTNKRESVKEGRPAKDPLSQREHELDAEAEGYDMSYNKNYRRVSRAKDQTQYYEGNKKPKYCKDPRDFMEQRVTSTEETRSCYYEEKRKESLEDFNEERKDFLEPRPATTEDQTSSYNRIKRKDLDKVRESTREQQTTKYYRERKEIPAAAEIPSSKYYDYELGKDSLEDLNELKVKEMRELNSEYDEFKTEDYRNKDTMETKRQKANCYKQDLGDPLEVKQPSSGKPRRVQSIQKSDKEFPNFEPESKEIQREILKHEVGQHFKDEMKQESESYIEEFVAQAEDPKREMISSPRKSAYKDNVYEQHEVPQEYKFPKQPELQDRAESHYTVKEVEEKIDEKSRTSSYQDFKDVMDHNLGFQIHRESQTDYNFESEMKQQNSTQTFNKETFLSVIPASTEEALDFLKNLIESTPKLGLRNECLNSVTIAAKDLITKLSSCQSSQQAESLTTTNERKSSNDTNNFNLEEKSTGATQYNDLETTTDTSENQLRKSVIVEEQTAQHQDVIPHDTNTFKTPANPPYCGVNEPGKLNFLQQESYQSQTEINPSFYSSTEIYESCIKTKENLDSSRPPQEFMEQAESLNTNISLCDENTLTYHTANLQPCLSLKNCKYRPLPSPRRQTAFDPDLQPLKGILKPCREMEESQNCHLLTQRSASVVNFGQRDEINIETESTIICQQEQEEIAQQFSESQNIIITGDQTLQPREKQINYKVNKITSLTPTLFQDCLSNSESNYAAFNGTNLCRPGVPEFKQCPCMLSTYNKMLINYYKGKK